MIHTKMQTIANSFLLHISLESLVYGSIQAVNLNHLAELNLNCSQDQDPLFVLKESIV